MVVVMATVTQSVEVRTSDTSTSVDRNIPDSTHECDSELSLTSSPPRRSAARLLLRTAFKDFSAVVPIVVGDGQEKNRPETRFLVHKELCTAASPFLAAALDGHFVEAVTQTVHLPEEKPEIFEWFLQWLYTGSLTTPSVGQGEVHSDGELRNAAGSPKYFLLLDLWALADRLLVTPLCNLILTTMARLSESTNSVPTPSDTWIIYDAIPENRRLRGLVLDLFAYKKTDRLLETHNDEWHPRFLRDLVVKLKRPGPDAVERHTLVDWTPRSWPTTRACEGCRDLLKPHVTAVQCCVCEQAFCAGCLKRHGEGRGWILGHDMSGCKPWMGRDMCPRYHEHYDEAHCA